MKKTLALILTAIILILSLASCGAKTDGKGDETTAAAVGKAVEADKFTIVVPDGWEATVIDGGFQIFKLTNEFIEVYVRGFDQSGDFAKTQVEWQAQTNSGTEVKEIDLLGKKFWNTAYTINGISQVFDACTAEGGMLISIKYGGPSVDSNPEYLAIVNSIIWK